MRVCVGDTIAVGEQGKGDFSLQTLGVLCKDIPWLEPDVTVTRGLLSAGRVLAVHGLQSGFLTFRPLFTERCRLRDVFVSSVRDFCFFLLLVLYKYTHTHTHT